MLSITSSLLFALPTLVSAGNHALQSNPSNSDIGLTTHGSDWLWAVFAVMLISDLVFIAWMLKLPRGARMFHQLPIIILTTASIAYFSMASNLGGTPIRTEFRSAGATRSIWYVRYIDWVITTPLLLLELLLGTGLSLSDIVTVVFFDLAMIVVGLVGALVASSYKWGYFVFGVFAELYIMWALLGPGRVTAGLMGTHVRKAYSTSAFFLIFIWALYPVAWGLADGSNTISVTGEMVFYGVLDILAKPVFCFLHVNALRSVPYETFGFVSGRHTEHSTGLGGPLDDKSRLNNNNQINSSTTNGTHNNAMGAGVGTGGGVGMAPTHGHNNLVDNHNGVRNNTAV